MFCLLVCMCAKCVRVLTKARRWWQTPLNCVSYLMWCGCCEPEKHWAFPHRASLQYRNALLITMNILLYYCLIKRTISLLFFQGHISLSKRNKITFIYIQNSFFLLTCLRLNDALLLSHDTCPFKISHRLPLNPLWLCTPTLPALSVRIRTIDKSFSLLYHQVLPCKIWPRTLSLLANICGLHSTASPSATSLSGFLLSRCMCTTGYQVHSISRKKINWLQNTT